MQRTTLCLFATLCLSCADLRETADATSSVRLGEGTLSPIEIERTMTLGVDTLPICLDVMITLPPDNTTVRLIRSENSCALSVSQPDLVLLDEQAIQNARKKSGNFDVDAVRRGSVSLEHVELWTDQGAPLDLSRYVDAVSIQIDTETVLERVTPAALLDDDGQPLKRPLPANLLNKLKSAVKSNQVASGDVILTLILHGETLSDLPGGLKLRVVMQPELDVNVVDAAF
jgi:hypothetical protein